MLAVANEKHRNVAEIEDKIHCCKRPHDLCVGVVGARLVVRQPLDGIDSDIHSDDDESKEWNGRRDSVDLNALDLGLALLGSLRPQVDGVRQPINHHCDRVAEEGLGFGQDGRYKLAHRK
jgi:hypothetical protein